MGNKSGLGDIWVYCLQPRQWSFCENLLRISDTNIYGYICTCVLSCCGNIFSFVGHGQQCVNNIVLENWFLSLVDGSVSDWEGVFTCPFQIVLSSCSVLGSQAQNSRAQNMCGRLSSKQPPTFRAHPKSVLSSCLLRENRFLIMTEQHDILGLVGHLNSIWFCTF